MTLSVPLSSEVFVATDAEGRDIFTTEVSVRYVYINYETGTVNAECTLPARTDVAFARTLEDLDDTSEATLVAALALDIEANFPAEKPPAPEPEAEPEAPSDPEAEA